MKIQQIRNATLRLDYAGRRFLIDPMFADKASSPGFPGTARSHLRNPLVALPVPVPELIDVDAVLITHTHPDHWDDAAREALPTAIPISNTRNNLKVVSIFTAAAIGLVGVLVILYAWQLPPFTRHSQFTDNAYVRGLTTFISPQVNGYITAVNVRDFDNVKQGDVLIQIDDRIYKQRVHQAQAQLAMKVAALNNNQQQRKSAEAVIARNEAALQNARAQCQKSQADLRRVKDLTADGSLSIRERDAALAGAAQSSADIEQAKATLEVSRQDLQSTIVNHAALQADVENAKASLELAQIDLQNSKIIAPRDGQLGQIAVRLGAYVSAGTHLTSLVPPPRWVIANVKETQLAHIRVGQPVVFTVDALNDKEFRGVVERISPATGVEFSAISPDNATGNFVKIAQRIPVRITINEDEKLVSQLRPGMSVQVDIDTHKEKP